MAELVDATPLAPDVPDAPTESVPEDEATAPPEAAEPAVTPVLPAPVEDEPDNASGLAVIAPPPAPVAPEAALPDATADPEAPELDDPLVPPPVEPEDSVVDWDTGPDAPDIPPAPEPVTSVLTGLEDTAPLVPPDPVALVVTPPLGPDEALPLADPEEGPLEPPVDVPVDDPLLPEPVEVPAPLPGPLPVEVLTAAGAAAVPDGAAAGWPLRAATIARLWISPVTPANGTRSRPARQPVPPEWDHSDHCSVW